jgi:hypothetical protein
MTSPKRREKGKRKVREAPVFCPGKYGVEERKEESKEKRWRR